MNRQTDTSAFHWFDSFLWCILFRIILFIWIYHFVSSASDLFLRHLRVWFHEPDKWKFYLKLNIGSALVGLNKCYHIQWLTIGVCHLTASLVWPVRLLQLSKYHKDVVTSSPEYWVCIQFMNRQYWNTDFMYGQLAIERLYQRLSLVQFFAPHWIPAVVEYEIKDRNNKSTLLKQWGIL